MGQQALLANHHASALLANATALLGSPVIVAPAPVDTAVQEKEDSNNSEEKAKEEKDKESRGSTTPPSHGTSAGFCNICKKFVSNRTNHKYVHSPVRGVSWFGEFCSLFWSCGFILQCQFHHDSGIKQEFEDFLYFLA